MDRHVIPELITVTIRRLDKGWRLDTLVSGAAARQTDEMPRPLGKRHGFIRNTHDYGAAVR